LGADRNIIHAQLGTLVPFMTPYVLPKNIIDVTLENAVVYAVSYCRNMLERAN